MIPPECEHRTITTYSFSEPDHETFGKVALWGCADCHRRFVPMPSDAPTTAPATEPSGERDGLREAAQRLCDAYADKAAVDGLTQSGHITDWHESAKADDAFLCALQDTRTALDGRERPHRHVPARAALDTGERDGLREAVLAIPGSCDWGGCDNHALLARFDAEKGWLPVCQWHAADASSADLAPITAIAFADLYAALDTREPARRAEP